MLIIVDANEQATAPWTVDDLRKHFGDKSVVIGTPASGDLNILLSNGGILAIERKTPSDLLNSIGDGRLFHQVENMANHANYSVIVITGYMSYDPKDDFVVIDAKTNWKGKSVRAALDAVQFSGCAIRTCSKNGYATTVGELYDLVNKSSGIHLQLKKRRVITFPPVSVPVEILSSFPGIGLKRAISLLEWASTTKGDECSTTLAQAIEWASIMALVNKPDRPEGWGDAVVKTFRGSLGLQPDECMKIHKG
jgi:ERCC4-type nuclease